MKVAELIERLKEYPPEAEVIERKQARDLVDTFCHVYRTEYINENKVENLPYVELVFEQD